MPIFDQGYQHWQGTLSGHAWRWASIARWGARTQWEKKWTRRVVIVSLFPALALAIFLVFWGLFEQQSDFLAPLLFLMRGLPEQLRSGPRNFRVPMWTLAFNTFLQVQLFFTMILVLIVGPDLISQDLRFNAMPLYFSRPVRRLDYFAGKLGVIAVYLSAVTIVPILLAYGLGVVFSLDIQVLRDTAWLLAGCVAYGLVVVLSAGTLILAISSLSRNSRMVGGIWVGVWWIGNLAAAALTRVVKVEWGPIVSYVNNLRRLRDVLLDTEAATKPIMQLVGAVRPRRMAADAAFSQYPWHWSAIVLLVLFGISLCILSLRVRSLDRLR
jgi:ABC-2 type transport system permease protein